MNARARRRSVLVSVLAVAAIPVFAQGPAPAAQRPKAPASQPSAAATPSGAKLPPPPLWWRDESFKKDLNLTSDQSDKIEKIFHDTRPQLGQQNNELQVLEDRLSKMIAKNDPEPQIIKQISEVELKRSALNISRSVMLFQMRQVLKPQQRTRFDVLHQKWEDDVWNPWTQQQERVQRDQRLKGDPKVGPQARPASDPQKRPQ